MSLLLLRFPNIPTSVACPQELKKNKTLSCVAMPQGTVCIC